MERQQSKKTGVPHESRDFGLCGGGVNKMKKSTQTLYNRKRPAHPDECHKNAKRWFKKKGRKSLRKFLKQEMKNQE